MSDAAASSEPVKLCDVLEEEFQLLHEDKAPTRRPPGVDLTREEEEAEDRRREAAFRARVHALPEPDQRLALCFSGGGIRSATFCLGVLQGLARRGWLDRFHYLSTVSGGGYIGSWLSSWIRAEGTEKDGKNNGKGLDRVVKSLATPGQGTFADPKPIRRLRAYSNYLSPVWGLSTDFFTLITIFLRNLVLNWFVLVPLLLAVLTLPRLHLLGLHLQPDESELKAVVGAALLLLAIGIGYITADLPGPRKAGPPPRSHFFGACFVPIVLAAILLSWTSIWMSRTWAIGDGDWWKFSAAGALVHLAGVVIGMAWRSRRGLQLVGGRSDWLDLLFILSSGVVGGWLVFKVVTEFASAVRSDFDLLRLFALFAVPALLACFWFATTVYAGLASSLTEEGDREWWARSGAWWLGAGVVWLLFVPIVIYVPEWLLGSAWLAKIGGAKALGAGGTVLGALTGAIGYWSKNGAKIREKAHGAIAALGVRTLDVAALAFILLLLVGLSWLVSWAMTCDKGIENAVESLASGAAYLYILENANACWLAIFMAAMVSLSVFSSYCVGVNTFSLHSMYGNRLVRAYLGAVRAERDPHWFTGFDPKDNVRMSQLKPESPARPRLFHVVNLALNLVRASGERLEWQQRKAASFTVSALHSGSAHLRFLDSANYSSEVGISLGRAMTISGAAASPNMGYHTSGVVSFVMAFFNVRLGWWLPNTTEEGRKHWAASEPSTGLQAMLSEALTGATDDSEFVYLSDGGHFENLGLYEMVRRRCRRIVVIDAGCDPKYEFEDLENAVRKIRVDLGIPIRFPDGLPTPTIALEDGTHHVLGVIEYGRVDGAAVTDGELVYVKPVVGKDVPIDVLRYATQNAKPDGAFPHQTTADQFFDEAQFESYRALGLHSIEKAFPAGGGWPSRTRGSLGGIDPNRTKNAGMVAALATSIRAKT